MKKTLGPSAAITLTPKAAQALIREGAERGMGSGRAPLPVDTPVVMELEYHKTDMRERGLELGGEPNGPRGIRFAGEDVPSTVRQVWRALAHTLREESAFLK